MVIAKPYMCVGAVLEIIIHKTIPFIVFQDDIANYFGLNVKGDDKETNINKKICDDSSKYGIIVGKDGINNFFSHYNLPLREEYHISYLHDSQSLKSNIIEYFEKNII